MGEDANAWLGLAAWSVAGSLALALGAVLFGCAAYRRARRVEGRLQALEGAVEEFCGALRGRLAVERSRLSWRDAVDEAGDSPSERRA